MKYKAYLLQHGSHRRQNKNWIETPPGDDCDRGGGGVLGSDGGLRDDGGVLGSDGGLDVVSRLIIAQLDHVALKASQSVALALVISFS